MARVKSILIGFLFLFELKVVESWWKMKVCLNGTIYSVEEYKCKAGVWLAEPRRVSSLCFETGIWALYEDWCQPNPIIWSVHPQTRGCISSQNLNKPISGIVYLGSHETGGLITTSGRRLFLNNNVLKHGKFDLLDDNSFNVFTWGTHSFAVEQLKGFTKYQSCLLKPRTEFFGYYHFELEDRQNVSAFVGENLCLDSKFRGDRTQKKPNPMPFEVYVPANASFKSGGGPACKTDKLVQRLPNQEDYVEDDDPKEIIQRKIDDQSQRIGIQFYASKFYNELPTEIDFVEWKFLEIAIKIFKKSCPTGMVSEFYLDNVFLLFQFLIVDSFTLFPPNVDPDEKTRSRIWNALAKCEVNATKFIFKNDNTCSGGIPLLVFIAANGTTILRLLQLPRQIKINVEKFDLILESVWKLMVFIHYYCAESFNEFSSDLSVLQNRWQSLLAPDMIRRWKNPGRSYDMLQRLFMSINLQKTIRNLDYCVGAAHMHSSYKGWLKRPLTKKELRLKNTSKEDLIWDGQAYCAKDFTYPAEKLGFPLEKCGIRYTN